jgi:cyclin A
MEAKVLSSLRFHVAGVTACSFLPPFLVAAKATPLVQNLAYVSCFFSLLDMWFLNYDVQYLAELCLPDYSSIQFKPSIIAASAVNLARQTLKQLQTHPEESWVRDRL